jgi:hypothetical protein
LRWVQYWKEQEPLTLAIIRESGEESIPQHLVDLDAEVRRKVGEAVANAKALEDALIKAIREDMTHGRRHQDGQGRRGRRNPS